MDKYELAELLGRLTADAIYIALIGLYIFIVYKLFMGVIKWNKTKNMYKVVRNIVITGVICFPVAMCEMIYVFFATMKERYDK